MRMTRSRSAKKADKGKAKLTEHENCSCSECAGKNGEAESDNTGEFKKFSIGDWPATSNGSFDPTDIRDDYTDMLDSTILLRKCRILMQLCGKNKSKVAQLERALDDAKAEMQARSAEHEELSNLEGKLISLDRILVLNRQDLTAARSIQKSGFNGTFVLPDHQEFANTEAELLSSDLKYQTCTFQ